MCHVCVISARGVENLKHELLNLVRSESGQEIGQAVQVAELQSPHLRERRHSILEHLLRHTDS